MTTVWATPPKGANVVNVKDGTAEQDEEDNTTFEL